MLRILIYLYVCEILIHVRHGWSHCNFSVNLHVLGFLQACQYQNLNQHFSASVAVSQLAHLWCRTCTCMHAWLPAYSLGDRWPVRSFASITYTCMGKEFGFVLATQMNCSCWVKETIIRMDWDLPGWCSSDINGRQTDHRQTIHKESSR
jgi:hypothetical protein